MKIILNVVFLLTISYSISAQQIPDLILTKEQNEKWFDELEQMDLSSQITSIRKRILLDTNVFIKRSYPHGIRPVNESEIGNRVEGCCKPLLIFGGTPFDGKEVEGYINTDDIVEVKIIRNVSASALYGMRGEAGVIFFTFRKKRTLDRMKKTFAKKN